MNTLIFEGAGWAGAEHNGVGNCRIRTRIRNKDGRLIYLEMGGGHVDYGRVDHCFYCDSKWDSRSSHSKDLAKFERAKFEYTKETILAFVNKNLNCTFDNMMVINDGIQVHNTKQPLCDCCEGNPEPFKEIEVNINELDGIEPLAKRGRYVEYKINWQQVKRLPYLKEWIDGRFESEQKRFKNYRFFAKFFLDERNIITELIVTAKESDFVHIWFSAEDVETVMEAIRKSNKIKLAVK